jgi:hypothetical protein
MPKQIDNSPIQVTRTHRSARYEVVFKDDGTVDYVLAHRWLVAKQNNADAVPAQYLGTVKILGADLTAQQRTQIQGIETAVDAADSL